MTRIAIVSTNKFKYSETFIHMQVKGLPFERWLLHGGYFPSHWSRGLDGADHALETLKAPNWQFWQGNGAEDCLLRWLKKEKIDLVLAQYGPSGVAVMDCCEKAEVPLLVHFHGYDAYRNDVLGSYGKRYAELFRRSAGQVVVSRAMHAQLLGLGAAAERLHLIPYGIDLDQFQVSQPGNAPPTLVSVGRFTPKKAPHLLVRAFARAQKEVPGARLLMVGEGELLEEVQQAIVANGLEEAVDLLGRQSPAAIAQHLGQARAFVQHSLVPESGDSEGLPLSILEAMACGLPIVSTRHAGIPEAVRQGKEGLLCEEGDLKTMGQNMVRVLKDSADAARMGRLGRLRAEEKYKAGRYLQELSALIAEVLRT